MNKLDEIEAELLERLSNDRQPYHSLQVDLLSRTVRQLGQAYSKLTEDMEHPWIDRFYHVYADVLDLIEETQ